MKIEKVMPWLDCFFILFGLGLLILSLLIRIDGRFFTVLGIGAAIFLLYLVFRAIVRKKVKQENLIDKIDPNGIG